MKLIKILIVGFILIQSSSNLVAQWRDTCLVTFQDFRLVQNQLKFQIGIQPEDDHFQLAGYSGVGMTVFNDTIMVALFNSLFAGEVQSPEGMLNQRVLTCLVIRVPNGITLDNGILRGRLTFLNEENEALTELGTFGVRMKLMKD